MNSIIAPVGFDVNGAYLLETKYSIQQNKTFNKNSQ